MKVSILKPLASLFSGVHSRRTETSGDGRREATKEDQNDEENNDEENDDVHDPYILRPVIKKSTRLFDSSSSWTGPVQGGYKVCCPWCFTPTYVSNAVVDNM